ncbi:MAG: hypothetical protein JXR30_02550 [Alphaproteobacteria bacterium]|nr:hypothetical protein [Alphaproteobacteria bacterium]
MKKRESGLSLLEVIFAISILMAVSPFVYKQMNRQTQEIRNVAVAKQLDRLKYAANNFVSVHHDSWENDFSESYFDAPLITKLKDYGLSESFKHFSSIIQKYQLSVKKEENETGSQTTSFLIAFLTKTTTAVQALKIIEHIGPDAGYAENGTAYGQNNSWKETLDGVDHAIVMKIFVSKGAFQETSLLSRTIQADLPEANSMETNLYFDSQYDIDNVQDIFTKNVVVTYPGYMRTNNLYINTEELTNRNKTPESTFFYAKTGYFYNTLYLSGTDSSVKQISSSDKLISKGTMTAQSLSNQYGGSSYSVSLIQEEDGASITVADTVETTFLTLKGVQNTGFTPKKLSTNFLKLSHLNISNNIKFTKHVEVKNDFLINSNNKVVFVNVNLRGQAKTCNLTKVLENLVGGNNQCRNTKIEPGGGAIQ